MKEYEAMVKTYALESNGGMGELLEEWSGSELFEAETELDALRDAVESLKVEYEEGLIGNPFGTKAVTMITEVLMQGTVVWNANDMRFADIVTMVERSE